MSADTLLISMNVGTKALDFICFSIRRFLRYFESTREATATGENNGTISTEERSCTETNDKDEV